MDIANLVIRVTNDGLTAAQRELRRLRDEVSRNVDANAKMKQGLDDLSKWAAIGLGALGGTMAVATKKAMSFETAMAEVNKTVDFAASDGLANLKNQLLDLSKVIPLTFEELAAVAASGGQLGIAEKDLASFTETVSKMAIAFDMSADEAGDAMAKLANVFEIPISEIDKLGDAINTLSNNSPAKASEIVNAMSRVGGLAKQFGLTEDATAALTSTFIALGKPAEIAASAVNSMLITFSTLDMASKSQLIGFEKLGVNIDEFAQRVKVDGKAAIYEFLEAVNKLPQEDRIGVIAPIIGREFGDDVAALAGSMGLLDKQMALVGETADSTKIYIGSMETEFQKMAATSENATTLFKNRTDALTATLGEAFLPVVNDLLLQIAPFIDKLTVWAQANPELIRQITLITASVLSSIVGIKLFADGVAMAVTTIDNLKTAFGLIKTSLTILSGGFALPLLAIAALIAAGVLLYQNWDLVKEKASELNEWVKSKFGSLPEPLQQAGRDIAEVFKFIWDAGREYLTLMGELYSGTFESFATIATGAFQIVWTVIKASFSGIVNIISGSLQVVATLFSGGFALIKNTVTMVLDVIKAVISGDFKAIPGIIGNGLKGALTIVGNMMSQILDIIKNYGKRLYSIGRDFIQGFINGIKSIGSGVASAATTMVGNAIAAVKKRQDSASPSKVTTKLGGDFSQGMANGIKKGAKVVKTEAQRMAEGAIKSIKDGIAGLKKELALFGNDSKLAAFNYDVSVGTFNGASSQDINQTRSLLSQIEAVKAEADAKTKLAAANKSVQDSIDGLVKQQALFGNSSSLASLMYDIEHTDKYKDATKELTDNLIEQTRALEQLGMTAKATAAIQARFAQFGKDKEAASTNLQSMLSGIEAASPLGKIEAEYAARNTIIEKYEQTHTDMVNVANEARLASDQAYMDAKRDLMLDQGEAIFGNLAGLSKAFLGEQSGMYKALFAIEKGYTLAKVLLKNKEAIAEAWASAPFPANLAAVATTVAGTAGLASAVSGIMPGFKTGGYTGNMGASQVAGVVHGQEYVFDAQSTKRIGVDNLNAMRSGKAPVESGGNTTMNVNVTYNSTGDTGQDKAEMTRHITKVVKDSWTRLQNPNSHESKMVKTSVKAPRNR